MKSFVKIIICKIKLGRLNGTSEMWGQHHNLTQQQAQSSQQPTPQQTQQQPPPSQQSQPINVNQIALNILTFCKLFQQILNIELSM